jgi:type VI secretion system protein ImpJ
MAKTNKIVWAEGVFLGQQHMQQWDQHHAVEQRMRTQHYAPLGWGIAQLNIDTDALANGLFRVQNCQMFLPDSQLIHYDATVDMPLTYDLSNHHGAACEIYLSIPANENVAGITGYLSSNELSHWRADFVNVPDLFDKDRQREVMVAKHNLYLLSNNDAREQYYSIKIARLMQTGEHEYVLDDKFVPSVIHLSASDVLQHCVRRLIELTESKIKVLNERRRSFSGDVTEFGQSDLAHFLLLEALQTDLPVLKHYQQENSVHPEALYLTLARIIGRLQAFEDASEVEIIAYQHHNLTRTFSDLENRLAKLMDIVLPTRVVNLNLQRESSTLYSVDHIDSVFLTEQTFFIGVYLSAHDASWIDRFAEHIKVGSREQLEAIVASALPGVQVTHMQRPPSKLPIKSGYEYFRLDPYGQYWDRIKTDRTLAMFVSQEFEQANIDLITVKE